MNITWKANGTFTTDVDQTEVIDVFFFTPGDGKWSKIELTINQTSVAPTGGTMIKAAVSAMVKPMARGI
jgi:hypothetical protein